ncbi:formylglycine-generating enzyme family protein [Falsiruegeria litorea]|nr:formylglycine-generating enzyme family protein [Falsiruegeria litorea]
MVEIPLGSFRMGSPLQETLRGQDEGPQTDVTIGNKFAVAAHEVTVKQWNACHRSGICTYKPSEVGGRHPQDPVLHVSWNDAQQFISWLRRETGKLYRLLTEAEWEYAARAGTATPFHTGETLTDKEANIDKAMPYPPQPDGPTPDPFRKRWAKPVGRYPANAFGLFDMHGNASEWVQDCYEANAYAQFQGYPSANEQGGASCDRVVRGGASHASGAFARSANRHSNAVDARTIDVGIRVGLTLID